LRFPDVNDMTFKPDFGLRQMKEGVSSSVDQLFHNFSLYSLTVLGRGQYSNMVDMPLAGELHALSLDFNQQQLDDILAKAPPRIAAAIRTEISKDPYRQRTIDFEGEVVFGVRARLGSLQKVESEQFVPLIAMEIF